MITQIITETVLGQQLSDKMLYYTKTTKYVKEYDFPVYNSDIRGIAVGDNGDVWFYLTNASSLARFIPSSGTFTQYPIIAPLVAKQSIINLAGGLLTLDKNGDIWFTDAKSNSIGKNERNSGVITMYQIPTENSGPLGIAADKNNQIWFTEITGDKIGKLDPETGRIDEYILPQNSGPALLTFDSKGILWFTLAYASKVAKLDPTSVLAGTTQGIELYDLAGFSSPFGIAAVNGILYISDHGSSKIAKFSPSTKSIKIYWTSPVQEVSVNEFPDTLPAQLLVDKRSNVWFAEHIGNRIARLDPITEVVTEYEIPSGPLSITLWSSIAPSGDVWFAEWASNKIGFVNASMPVPFVAGLDRSIISLESDSYATVNLFVTSASDDRLDLNFDLAGMTDSGISGLEYSFIAERITLDAKARAQISISIKAMQSLSPDTYSVMVRASDGTISQLIPMTLVVTQQGAVNTLSPAFPQSAQLIAIIVLAIIGALMLAYRVKSRRKD